jgi:hypothetical protein
MFTRKLGGLVAVAVVLGLSSVAFAGDTKYVALLEGTRLEPRADARAVWMAMPNEIHFSVAIKNCAFCVEALVEIDGMFIGQVDIVDGDGLLHLNIPFNAAGFPRVKGGTSMGIWSLDGALLLHGKFRERTSDAQTTYSAHMIAQRGDQLAKGRAVWQAQDQAITFSVHVDAVRSAEWVTVVVDGRYVGEFDIVDGSGALVLTNQQEAAEVPRVHAGSNIVIYAEDTDRPILYGAFRSN